MKNTRPTAVTIAVLLVALVIMIAVIASLIAAFAPADYKTYAVTTPLFLVLLFAAVAYYLWGWSALGASSDDRDRFAGRHR